MNFSKSLHCHLLVSFDWSRACIFSCGDIIFDNATLHPYLSDAINILLVLSRVQGVGIVLQIGKFLWVRMRIWCFIIWDAIGVSVIVGSLAQNVTYVGWILKLVILLSVLIGVCVRIKLLKLWLLIWRELVILRRRVR